MRGGKLATADQDLVNFAFTKPKWDWYKTQRAQNKDADDLIMRAFIPVKRQI